MMIDVEHETAYTYSRYVKLNRHTFRFRPREDAAQRIVSFDLDVQPTPSATTLEEDESGNRVTRAWFAGGTNRLRVASRFRVETTPPAPLADAPGRPVLPAVAEPTRVAPAVTAYAKAVASDAGGRLVPFLIGLAERIQRDHASVVRPEGDPYTAAETLARREGACRDFAVLFMDACASVGVAARFVSGYHVGDDDRDRWDLHAWAEAWVPDVGWRGFDPSVGREVGEAHVAVAAAATPRAAAPVEGTYAGPGAVSYLKAQVEVRAVE